MPAWTASQIQALAGAQLRPGEQVLTIGFGENGPGDLLCGMLARTLERLSLVQTWRLVFTDQRILVLRRSTRHGQTRTAVRAFSYNALHDLMLARGRLRGRLAFTAAGQRWNFALPRPANDVSAIADALQGGGALLRAV